jgi:DNA helicase HerA-like ATPase
MNDTCQCEIIYDSRQRPNGIENLVTQQAADKFAILRTEATFLGQRG